MSRIVLTPADGPGLAAAGADRSGRVASILSQRATNWLRRRRLGGLVDLDDRMLADIGLTRAEVLWARRLPLHRNPVAELRQVADRRRSRQLELMRRNAGMLAL